MVVDIILPAVLRSVATIRFIFITWSAVEVELITDWFWLGKRASKPVDRSWLVLSCGIAHNGSCHEWSLERPQKHWHSPFPGRPDKAEETYRLDVRTAVSHPERALRNTSKSYL